MFDPKRLVEGYRYCREHPPEPFGEVGKKCVTCPIRDLCDEDGVDNSAMEAITQLLKERDAAIKVLQRFSYDNTKKCRWCKFAKYSESDKRWIPCAHPRSLFPYYQHCTRFEYEYRAETNEKE